MIRQIILADTENNTYINTSNIKYDEKNNIVELSENSKINIDDTNIFVDRGVIDYNSNELEVFGNFYLYQELNILSGKNLIGDTNLNNFKAKDVSYLYNNDLKIDSDKAKREDNLIVFYNNFLTPCEIEGFFNCPTWSLRIDETNYYINEDKFVHYDTFLQIADYKVFYLPYFSHYGVKAPRKRGFLTPTIEFTIGGGTGIKIPYYLPLTDSTDITFKTNIKFDQNFEFMENYKLNTKLNNKSSGGSTNFVIDTIKNKNSDNINNSIKIDTKQVINKNMIISAKGLFTNSISTSRSVNENPVKFEETFVKLENYNFLRKNDYLKTELATIEAFDASDINQIPISPTINYISSSDLSNNTSLFTELDYVILNRDESSVENPSENYIFNFNNYYIHNIKRNNLYIFNKISSFNSINSYKFEHNRNLDRQENYHSLILSSDIHINLNHNIKPRIKLIQFNDLVSSEEIINEDSNSVSFNYSNQFSDKRFFGNDLTDNTSRVVYGIENDIEIVDQNFKLNINQSYDFNKNNNFTNKINQNSNFSDYSLELGTLYKNLNIGLDMRLNESTFSRKEMNYSLTIDSPLNIEINYHETDKQSYNGLSDDSKFLGYSVSKKINDNVEISYGSKLDLKNNFSPYKEGLSLNLSDECSNLNIKYSNTRFNDDYNTSPEEIISITFSMDYLGFFGYEQKTDLLFKQPGNINYGL